MGITIERDKLYTEWELRATGVFKEHELRKARAQGLKSKELRRGKRVYRGSWLLRWLEGRPEKKAVTSGGN